MNHIKKNRKKGMFFTVDAILAVSILALSMILLTSYFVKEDSVPQSGFISMDSVDFLAERTVSELNEEYLQELAVRSNSTNANFSLLEQIGIYWVKNETGLAINLSRESLEGLIPVIYGFSVLVDGQLVYERSKEKSTSIISSRRMFSGIEPGRPVEGATGRVYLAGIGGKLDSSYLYYGGFVGQGNITKFIDDIPPDANLTGIFIELEAGDNFSLYINNIFCDNVTVSAVNMTADSQDLSHCRDSIVVANNTKNNFTIVFKSSNLNNSFVGGGFIRVKYRTREVAREIPTSLSYSFPEISGIMNLYSSLYIPGELNKMNISLHYFADNPTNSNVTLYLTIGNKTVLLDTNLTNTTPEKWITINDSNLSAVFDYSKLGQKTIPIRMGFESLNYTTRYIGNADVSLVTDMSGSMEFCTNALGDDHTDWRWVNPTPYPDLSGDPSCSYKWVRTGNCVDNAPRRIEVTKNISNDFIDTIIGVAGNRMSLVEYSAEYTLWQSYVQQPCGTNIIEFPGGIVGELGLTPDSIPLKHHINNMTHWYGTCVCCGINHARDSLIAGIQATQLINAGSVWLYNTTSDFSGAPPPDNEGDLWYEPGYDDSQWKSGSAVLGSNYQGGITIDSDIGNSVTTNFLSPQLWELNQDSPLPVDFTSGLNYTGNVWGPTDGIGDDGWDSIYGAFGDNGYDVNMNTDPNENGDQSDNTVNSQNRIRIRIGYRYDRDWPSADETPSSSAFGLEIEVTDTLYSIIEAGGNATLLFDWKLDRSSGLFSGEAGWIKANFGTEGNMAYLGSDLDSGGVSSDGSNDIFWCEDDWGNNPCVPDPRSETSITDITGLINGPGWYYLVIGAKATENPGDFTWDESWRFYFDNINIRFNNGSDHYFFRRHFTVDDLSDVRKGVLNVLSDDYAVVYLNGYAIDVEEASHEAEYWNRRGINVPGGYFVEGDNVIAVELFNSQSAAKFDLELIGINDSRDKVLMAMTDGGANVRCDEQGTGDATQDTIKAACDASEDYGIRLHAVGFSDEAEEDILQGIAECGNGFYRKSNDTADIEEFYYDMAELIKQSSQEAQIMTVESNILNSRLFSDSTIMINFTPNVTQPQYGEISLNLKSESFDSCNATITIPQGVRVADSRVTSYSAEHWTDLLIVNDNTVYNLSEYNNEEYYALGDPYFIYVPPSLLVPGINNITIGTGNSPVNYTGCSQNNSLIYTGMIQSALSYSTILEKAEGCTWNVEYNDGTFDTIKVPQTYAGANLCSFTNAFLSYDVNDTYDLTMLSLMDRLDLDDDRRLEINLEENELYVNLISIENIPYLWGPSMIEVRVWQ